MFENKKLVMVTPERLGDTLMLTPAIHLLKQTCPSTQIDIIALSDLSAEVLKNNPDIHRIFVLPGLNNLNQYDHGINIHNGQQAQKYFKALNIRTDTINLDDPNIHQAEQALLFIQNLLSHPINSIEKNYRLFPTTEDYAHIEKIFNQQYVDLKQDILIGIQIGCHSIAKKRFGFIKKLTHPKIWPFEYIVELAKKLYCENPKIKIVITGSKTEMRLGKKLSKLAPNIINFIDLTTVPQLYALMKYLKLFISPDTGLMHVACAANIPLIALFGPTDLKRTGPYPELKDLTLIQAPNMNDISVDEVFRAAMRKI